jgi:hypothetical protein
MRAQGRPPQTESAHQLAVRRDHPGDSSTNMEGETGMSGQYFSTTSWTMAWVSPVTTSRLGTL